MRRRSRCDFYRVRRKRNIMVYTAAVIIFIFLAPTQFILISSLTSVLKQSDVIEQLEINVTHLTNREVTAKKVPSYIKTKTDRIYLFSAIIAHIENDHALKHNQTQNITEVSPTAIVTGWEHKSGSSHDFKCCFRLKNGTFVSVLSWNKSHWLLLEIFNLQAKQFKCPVNFDIKDLSSITILADRNETCPEENVFYVTPTIIKHNKRRPKNIRSRNVGVCVKLTYGSLDAQRLIEWFEIHKLFGVDKVIAYTYQLNSKAAKVLKFYERSGMAQVYDFDFPEKDIIKRNIGDENDQYWNDEQVVLFDCQERLRNYDYVAVVDTDEFLLPRTKHFKNAWKIYLENKFRKENVGALFFSVRIHAYTWGPSNKSHPLHIGRYSNCTFPMYDRTKGVYMPSRIRQGSVWTHGAYPLQGFTSYVANMGEAVIHHYRHCRKEWLKTSSTRFRLSEMYLFHMKHMTKCTDFRRSHSDVIGQLADTIKDDVFRRLEEIEL